MVLQIHDEVIMEGPQESKDEVKLCWFCLYPSRPRVDLDTTMHTHMRNHPQFLCLYLQA